MEKILGLEDETEQMWIAKTGILEIPQIEEYKMCHTRLLLWQDEAIQTNHIAQSLVQNKFYMWFQLVQ